jgi:hypothetical protein
MMNKIERGGLLSRYYAEVIGMEKCVAVMKAAKEVLASENISVIIRHMDENHEVTSYDVLNFSHPCEVTAWLRFCVDEFERDAEYVKLDPNNVFYNSVWGTIPDDVAAKCCEPVRKRIAVGM